MAFPILLQRNNSEQISLTKDLTTILEMTAVLKDETSIIDPVFVLECSIEDVAEVNYLTVSAFRRSYFVNNVTSITNGLVELTAHVDVLSSFASEIKANKGIVFRQENNWNLYLNDGVIQAYQNPIVTTQAFPKGFTEQNYVLVCAGSRNIGGVYIGDGGSIDTSFPDEAGTGNNTSKTTAGLVNYCKAQVGRPYWFGTFGNIADQNLLDYKRNDYPNYYPNPGSPAFVSQFGERVHDCVGLIKGYRWSDTPNSTPQYVASQDVDVRSLYSQCTKLHGNVDFSITSTEHIVGMCVFDSALTHVGVYIGNGKIIEARGHAYGVVINDAYDRRGKFTLWGIPDWLKITTSYYVYDELSIISQPQDVTCSLGDTVSFSVVADGYNLTYQWQYSTNDGSTWRNSSVGTPTNPTYVIEATAARNGNLYRCIIMDGYGNTLTSNAARLTIT